MGRRSYGNGSASSNSNNQINNQSLQTSVGQSINPANQVSQSNPYTNPYANPNGLNINQMNPQLNMIQPTNPNPYVQPQQSYQGPVPGVPVAPNNQMNNLVPSDPPKQGASIGVVIVIVICIVALLCLGGFFLISLLKSMNLKNGYETEDDLYKAAFTSISNKDEESFRKCLPDKDVLKEDSQKALDNMVKYYMDENLVIKYDLDTLELKSEKQMDSKTFDDEYGIEPTEGKAVRLYIEFNQSGYRASQEFDFTIGLVKGKWFIFDFEPDTSSIIVLGDSDVEPNINEPTTEIKNDYIDTGTSTEEPTETSETSSTQSESDTYSGSNDFASYQIDEEDFVFNVYPKSSFITDETILPGVNIKYGDLSKQCHNVLEEGNTFDDDLFKDFICIMFYDTENMSKENAMQSIATAASFANEFSDEGMRIKSLEMDLTADEEIIKLHTDVSGTENIIWITDYKDVKLNDGKTDYSSTMFDDDTLATWYVAIEDVANGNMFEPSTDSGK